MRGPTRPSSSTSTVSPRINTAATMIPGHSGGLGRVSKEARRERHPKPGGRVRQIGHLLGAVACSPRFAGAPVKGSAPTAHKVSCEKPLAGLIATTLPSTRVDRDRSCLRACADTRRLLINAPPPNLIALRGQRPTAAGVSGKHPV